MFFQLPKFVEETRPREKIIFPSSQNCSFQKEHRTSQILDSLCSVFPYKSFRLHYRCLTSPSMANKHLLLCTYVQALSMPSRLPSGFYSQLHHCPSVYLEDVKVTTWLLKWFVVVESLKCVLLFVTPWTTARQASLSLTISRSSPKFMSIELMMPSNHLFSHSLIFSFNKGI